MHVLQILLLLFLILILKHTCVCLVAAKIKGAAINTIAPAYTIDFPPKLKKPTMKSKEMKQLSLCVGFLVIYIHSHLICNIMGIYATVTNQGPNIVIAIISFGVYGSTILVDGPD